jgi:phosphoglycerate dehydrogenase-like enzyme
MRLLMSETAARRFGPRVAEVDRSIEVVVMADDGTLHLVDGPSLDPEDAGVEVAWGSVDIFTDGGPMVPFLTFVRSAPGLGWYQSPAAGIDHPMYGEMILRGTRVTTMHVQSVAIAEYVLRVVLDHFQDAPWWWAAQQRREWERRRFREISGTTWLVIGVGAIGCDVARRASAFGARVIGMRRRPEGTEPVDEMVSPGDLSAVSRADVIVIAAPATTETHHLVDEGFLAAMKPDALLVNVARGALVDEPALLAALDRGQLGGAVLDVTEREPLPADDPLWSHPGVSITPHTAAHGDGTLERAGESFIRNLHRYVNGEALENEVAES